MTWSVVVPTVGRPSLYALLRSLARQPLAPEAVVVVDDRRDPDSPLDVTDIRFAAGARVTVLPSGGRGPAAARNVGWRAVTSTWVVFLDDDVLLPPGWADDLADDLAGDLTGCDPTTGGVQGRLEVPLPDTRRPTDWQRNTRGLETAAWATADMAYRREALAAVGGFDERFPRAYREDADLAVRVQRAGWRLRRGTRRTVHPVRPADRWVSVRVQAGNADDPLMRRLHGPEWRRLADVPAGRRPRNVAVSLAGAAAAVALLGGRRRTAGALAAVWAAGTAELAWTRVAPGPRDREEVVRMVLTSVAIPPVATLHWLRGLWRHRAAAPWPVETSGREPSPGETQSGEPSGQQAAPAEAPGALDAVLFDRDGTLVHDVPYNGDPALVRPVAGAAEVVSRLRAAGVRVGVVSNQSGVARGLLTPEQVEAVNARVDELLGPFDVWQVCPHGPDDGCACRKPQPGMVLAAAAALGVAPQHCAVIGDIGADVEAARAAGARGVLVPTPVTRPDEVDRAPLVAPDLASAVDLLMSGRAAGRVAGRVVGRPAGGR